MLELQNIRAAYGRAETLHGISAVFESRSLSVLLGPNGCGKSTLLKVAAGLLVPTAGRVLLDGIPFAQLSQPAQKIAFLPQSRNVPNLTAERLVLHGRFPYLAYPRRYRERDHAAVRAAMETIGISALAEKNMLTLSGGERQKVYLAMALAQGTEVILMDEPTTFLDVDCQMAVWEIAQTLRDLGKTVVIVTHDLPQALRRADHLLVLQAGQLLAAGTAEALLNSGALASAFHVQLAQTGGHYYLL